MPRVRAGVLAALVLSPLVLVAACAAELGPGPAGPATALTVPAEPRGSGDGATGGTTSRATPPVDGDDVAACFDGDCRVRVPDGTTIRVDPRFEVPRP